MGTTVLRRADDLAEMRILAADLTQLCLDIAGIADPTPISDGANALISLARGQWLDSLLSGVSMVPYVGDLAKAGKFPKYLKTVERAILLAQRSTEAAKLLAPVMQKLSQALDLLPDHAPEQVQRLRSLVRRFLLENRVPRKVVTELPDIRDQFRFKPRWREGNFEYEQISGKLGVPGKVQVFDSAGARKAVSAHTGDHAGHRIGKQFGAPTDPTNLSLQNANINTYAPKSLQPRFQGPGGNYLKVEQEWARKLDEGWGIEVTVRDRYRPGETRPVSRLVEWTEISPRGAKENLSIEYLNTSSPQTRAKAGQ